MTRPKTLRDSLPGLRHTLSAFAPYLRRQRWMAIGSIIALLAGVGLKLLEPWPLKWVFDHVHPGVDGPVDVERFAIASDLEA